jgi:hypothetical protein
MFNVEDQVYLFFPSSACIRTSFITISSELSTFLKYIVRGSLNAPTLYCYDVTYPIIRYK